MVIQLALEVKFSTKIYSEAAKLCKLKIPFVDSSFIILGSCFNSLQYGLKWIRYLGAKLWNTLPVELRKAPSKISFKKQLKIYLLNKVCQ